MNWLSRLFSPRRPETPAAGPATAKPITASSARARARPAPAVAASPDAPLLPWLLQCTGVPGTALTRTEQRALDALDKVLALPTLPDDLVPRAAALIPQLLALLRQTDLPVAALSQRVGKDMVLAAEVLRLASSPFYRAQGSVTDLTQAISLIGEHGLQTVIARVVLKPMYEAPPGTLSARAAGRLWEHAEALARDTASGAAAAGEPAFDGYLAGLLHGTGWSVAFRVLDRAGLVLSLPPSEAFAAAGAGRAHRLFGQAAQRWAITPGFSAFGADAREHPLAGSSLPLAAALREALPKALAEIAPGAAP
jgi:hypothetical protein